MAHLLADSITLGKEIPLYENGNMWRDWTHVQDITDGIIAALDRQLGYEIINLGRGEPTLLSEFIEMMEELAQGTANFVHKPKSPGDMWRTYANIDKARKLLDYDPQVSLVDGVADFWRWYQQRDSD